jgi:hypothetical protein
MPVRAPARTLHRSVRASAGLQLLRALPSVQEQCPWPEPFCFNDCQASCQRAAQTPEELEAARKARLEARVREHEALLARLAKQPVLKIVKVPGNHQLRIYADDIAVWENGEVEKGKNRVKGLEERYFTPATREGWTIDRARAAAALADISRRLKGLSCKDWGGDEYARDFVVKNIAVLNPDESISIHQRVTGGRYGPRSPEAGIHQVSLPIQKFSWVRMIHGSAATNPKAPRDACSEIAFRCLRASDFCAQDFNTDGDSAFEAEFALVVYVPYSVWDSQQGDGILEAFHALARSFHPPANSDVDPHLLGCNRDRPPFAAQGLSQAASEPEVATRPLPQSGPSGQPQRVGCTRWRVAATRESNFKGRFSAMNSRRR